MSSTARLRLTPPEPSETELHEAVVQAIDLLVLPPAMVNCFPAGHIPLPPAAAAALFRAGLKRGWPDLLVIHDARVFGIELKKPGCGLSKTRTVRSKRTGALRLVEGQADVHPRLEAAGMTIGLARSVDEVLALLRGWGVPLRRYG